MLKPTMGDWMVLLKNGFGRGKAAYTTSTVPKMKAYAPPASDYVSNIHKQQHGKQSSKSAKQDFVPVYVAVGMIALSSMLGLHTAWQHLRNNPSVRVKKQGRESVPEVVEPEHVMEESDKLYKNSFFRKVAHVQERSYPDHSQVPSSINKDVFAHQPRVETLKSVGVDPSQS
ncbi:uncharacterized protein LOC127106246 [Lathyrus oleraceus]|uniref:Uncharacterized protein n=2 Tax=Pisum sativum TaxID=3888 RepID=A0A9D4VJ70_PEA|nr:uncharacterized protein LOC127106246 [Pisum sativum]KAI5383914.1 hypothetical protein KIW84_071048 [Pisum sativum]